MPATRPNLVGRVFGRWTVVAKVATENKRARWLCRCSCGVEKIVIQLSLLNADSRSCGCLKKDLTRKRLTTHGLAGRCPEYSTWQGMISRCTYHKNVGHERYGGRGITVCDRWRNSFQNFLNDMGKRPSAKHTLERLDNDGDYEPNNCVWAMRTTQQNNLRTNIRITFEGRTQTLAQWTRELGFARDTIRSRLARGWPVVNALTKPPKPDRRHMARIYDKQ